MKNKISTVALVATLSACSSNAGIPDNNINTKVDEILARLSEATKLLKEESGDPTLQNGSFEATYIMPSYGNVLQKK